MCVVVSYCCFLKYILLIVLLQLSKCFPLCSPLPGSPHSLRQSSHLCSCLLVMCVSPYSTPLPILYFTSPWLFCNYLFVLLNPLTSSPIPPNTSSHLAMMIIVSVLFVCVVCFSNSIFGTYVFIAILLYIVLIFFFNKSL